MKQLLLLLMLHASIISFAANTDSQSSGNRSTSTAEAKQSTQGHKTMLEEGRTWWYQTKHYFYGLNDYAESGITIGEEVEINGVKWHKIDIVSEKDYKDGVWSHVETPITVAYLREEGNKVYAAYFDGVGITKAISGAGCRVFEGEDHTMLIFDYKNIGESFIFGQPDGYYHNFETFTIQNITQVSNTGNEYTLYECWDTAPDRWPSMKFIEGLGSPFNLFFAPLYEDITSYMKYEPPYLRYVTDPDGTIIYEGIGGYKLWEESSVSNVLVEGDGGFRWYNLHGVEIEEPTTPGIYIRSSRNGNEKIAIQ